MPAVVVANCFAKMEIGGTGDAEWKTLEYPISQVVAHKPYTVEYPDLAGQYLAGQDWLHSLYGAWDSFRNNLIRARAESGHEKQRVEPEVKKVCPRVCLPCAIIWS